MPSTRTGNTTSPGGNKGGGNGGGKKGPGKQGSSGSGKKKPAKKPTPVKKQKDQRKPAPGLVEVKKEPVE